MDRGAWWAAVHGVAESRTWLSDFTFTFTFVHWRRKWQPTPVFLPGESQGWGAWWAAVYGVAQSRPRLKWLSSSSNKIELDTYVWGKVHEANGEPWSVSRESPYWQAGSLPLELPAKPTVNLCSPLFQPYDCMALWWISVCRFTFHQHDKVRTGPLLPTYYCCAISERLTGGSLRGVFCVS